jgi:hypothetical protein
MRLRQGASRVSAYREEGEVRRTSFGGFPFLAYPSMRRRGRLGCLALFVVPPSIIDPAWHALAGKKGTRRGEKNTCG